ncbi:MAG: glycosyltransferase family 4 protein [Chloroflexi bacterium]|nr:glycosyltransferase family 4 protein [Chloroflexota bacterium]
MRLGFVSTRFAGVDGVSLEAAKWAHIFRGFGHEVVYCAGERDAEAEPGCTVPEMHFLHPEVRALQQAAFGAADPEPGWRDRLNALAERLAQALERFLHTFRVDVLVVENALAIPMHLALGMALHRVLERTRVPAIGHHHDFYWERARFRPERVADVLAHSFPPALPNLRHVVINSLAQRDLKARRGLSSVVVPNVFDFRRAARGLDEFGQQVRAALGLAPHDLLILQPTRVIPRKGIEHAVDLVAALNQHPRGLYGHRAVLVLSHPAGDEGYAYLRALEKRAREARVPWRYAAERFGPRRGQGPHGPIFSLADAYLAADFVTYPSLYEGFGNAFLEAIYYRVPLLVNRYPVYDADIRPKGFDVVEMEGEVTQSVVEAAREALLSPVRRRAMVEWNYARAWAHFSYEAIEPTLRALLAPA